MENIDSRIRDLVLQLHNYGALKFGEFKMKVGVNSPVYFDLRVMVSYPQLMDNLSQLTPNFVRSKNVDFNRLCGVPYTALPIATLMCVKSDIPMLMRRKEAKNYGTKKMIEGRFDKGDKCLIVEDVCTSGSSILETYEDLVKEGLEGNDCVIVVDRQQGGHNNLLKKGIRVHALTTLSKALEILFEAGRIDSNVVEKVNEYTRANTIELANGVIIKSKSTNQVPDRIITPFSVRSQHSKCVLAGQLFKMIEEKKSNLCLAADVTSSVELLSLAQTLGPYIVIFKIHADIVKDFSQEIAGKLRSIAQSQQFLIMEDRKFADIGETVRQQYCSYSPWADLVTVHPLPGDGVLKALKTAFTESTSEPRAVFIVAQLSCQNNLITTDYTKDSVKMAESYSDIVAGFVCQSSDVIQSVGQLQLTPGVNISTDNDSLGQQYSSPDVVMGQKGADIAVVGRGIIKAKNIVETAKNYQTILWEAYQNRINHSR
ncbi:hypothetical protein LSTR_LSTR007352 [Laodelphax striatellus]|uniref:Uridine 5'-monophosphate synthase n=1 Tax=Laodelphax striatellus TaxID=195883 RepID=A0A482XMR2_LAOST|nr:hypothetical protein LSTR_LSTR007352 [Laodelphax striatellus]